MYFFNINDIDYFYLKVNSWYPI